MGDDVMVLTLTRETRTGSERVGVSLPLVPFLLRHCPDKYALPGRLRPRRNRSSRSRRGPRRPEDRQTAREPGPGLTRKEIYERLHPETNRAATVRVRHENQRRKMSL
jgi:hypothetical protein